MKESMGGTWLLGMVALFIVLFSAFLAYSINYTKAFRAKNGIIDLIEQNEGFTFSLKDGSGTSTEEKAYELIKSMGYDFGTQDQNNVVCDNDKTITDSTKLNESYKDGGYCVYHICNSDGSYRYKVVTYVIMKFPIINFGISVPIKGETKTLYYEVDNAFGGSADRPNCTIG